jgi:hypothetical protein
MAIPTSTFTNGSGVALMRQNVSTAEWFFVGWVAPAGLDSLLDEPGPGNYLYALWVVLGASSTPVSAGFGGGQHSISLLQLRR